MMLTEQLNNLKRQTTELESSVLEMAEQLAEVLKNATDDDDNICMSSKEFKLLTGKISTIMTIGNSVESLKDDIDILENVNQGG